MIFLAVGLHEYAHCKFADLAGDPTPRIYGRVTLNLFRHFEITGLIMILVTAATGFGIGWGNPAPMNPAKMKNPKWDFFIAVLAGPLSNVVQAVVWAFLAALAISFGMTSHGDLVAAMNFQDASNTGRFFVIAIRTNMALALFNMIPLGPLDGHWIVKTFLPDPYDLRWERFHRFYGRYILIGLVLMSQAVPGGGFNPLNALVFRPAQAVTSFLIGIRS